MKEAMGETTFTIIIIVAAAIIIGALTLFLPRVINRIENKWNRQIDTYNTNADAKEFVVGNYTFTI
jgi:hypothetical protein